MNQMPDENRGAPRWVKVTLWSVGAIVVLYLTSAWAIVNIFMVSEPRPIAFDQHVWQSPKRGDQARHAMLADLIEKHKLVGMTRPEIEGLLGKPDRPGREWYKLGPQSGFGIDDVWLELTYKDGKIIKHETKYD
jgi:hypothetical protein